MSRARLQKTSEEAGENSRRPLAYERLTKSKVFFTISRIGVCA